MYEAKEKTLQPMLLLMRVVQNFCIQYAGSVFNNYESLGYRHVYMVVLTVPCWHMLLWVLATLTPLSQCRFPQA